MSSRRRRIQGMAGLMLLLVVGCAPASSPTTSGAGSGTAVPASPTIAPSPTPVPFDLAKVLPLIQDTGRAKFILAGTIDDQSQVLRIDGTLTYDASGSNAAVTVLSPIGDTTKEIVIFTVGYIQYQDGPWLQEAVHHPADEPLAAVFKAMPALTDVGTATVDGRTIHRLTPTAAPGLTLGSLGLNGLGFTDPELSLVVDADDGGTPVALELAITGTRGTGDQAHVATAAITFKVAQFGGTLVVQAPTPVWPRFASSRYHYAMARPSDWDVKAGTDFDEYIGPDSQFVFVTRAKSSLTVNQLVAQSEAYEKKQGLTKLSSTETTLGGVRANFLIYQIEKSGSTLELYEVVAAHAGYAYIVDWSSDIYSADRVIFDEMLGTFAFR